MNALLDLKIIDSPFVGVIYTLGVGAAVFVLLRRPSRRWLITALAALLAGILAAFFTLLWASVTDAFGVDLSAITSAWVYLTFTAIAVAIVNLWRSGILRKVISALSIALFLAVGTVGINADFGLDPTVADLMGVSTAKTVALPSITPKPEPSFVSKDLWASWKAPKSMPTVGTDSQVVIPNTLSGFHSRPAGLYLPPAALVKNPPELPLVIMLMGQPGNPDPAFQSQTLDAFAARHNGLAPIVLIVDQLGNPAVDPLCIDSAKFGKAETFITKDAVDWARGHLRVLPDAAHWTIAGYSNGGVCALALGAKHPDIWGNVLDISGESFPGSDNPRKTLASVFGGNQAAYTAIKPTSILAGRHYADTTAIFTVGSDDKIYLPQAKAMAAAARAAGWTTTYFEVPNGGHVLKALMGGLAEGYSVLYPRLGLSAPGGAV